MKSVINVLLPKNGKRNNVGNCQNISKAVKAIDMSHALLGLINQISSFGMLFQMVENISFTFSVRSLAIGHPHLKHFFPFTPSHSTFHNTAPRIRQKLFFLIFFSGKLFSQNACCIKPLSC